MPIYLCGAAQISAQQPLTDAWLTAPEALPKSTLVRAIDPPFRSLLPAAESRRMGVALKRMAVVADSAMAEAGLGETDAIVVGTGMGCVESTEHFLDALCRQGERLLGPTHFMQSTHNTPASLLARRLHCHGYNATFSHEQVSFDQALYDAFLLMRTARAVTVLCGGIEEVTPTFHILLRRMGYVGHAAQVACSEAAAAFVLTTQADKVMQAAAPRAILADMCMGHLPPTGDTAAKAPVVGHALDAMLGRHGLTVSDIDAVIVPNNGYAAYDALPGSLLAQHLPHVPQVAYKRLFGECFCASALGLYMAQRLIERGHIPTALVSGGMDHNMDCSKDYGQNSAVAARRLLLVNHSMATDFSLILLTSSSHAL